MLPLRLRSHLFATSFQTKELGLMDVPLITWTDVALIPKVGWRKSYQFIRQFQEYRQQLNIQNWSCLTSFYPRANYMVYYYVLFWWADYCDGLASLLTAPHNSLIAELFYRYIVEIDRLIDAPNGKDYLNTPARIKRQPDIAHYLASLMDHIRTMNLSSSRKRALCHHIWDYRQTALAACQNSTKNNSFDLVKVLVEKEQTAGELLSVWAAVLRILYKERVSEDLSENAREVLANTCMAMQVIDDMIDLPVDWSDNTSNIFLSLLKEEPVEFENAQEHLRTITWNHLDGIWARQNLPNTYNKSLDLINDYLKQALINSAKPDKTAELCQIIGNLPRHVVGV